MTNIRDLLEKVKGDKLSSDEFVRLVTAVIENQELGKKLDDNKVGYVIRTTDEGIYARFFVDEDTANNYMLNPEDPDFQPIVSIPLPSGGGGETVYEVALFSNSPLAIASPNKNVSVNIAFTTRSYVASTDTWRDNAEDGIIEISRKVGDGAWTVVKTIPNFTRTLYADRDINQRPIDLSDCLVNGDQDIMIAATGSRTLATAVEIIYSISVAEMGIQSSDNWQEPKIYNPLVASSANMSINYKISGNTNKSIYYKGYDASGNVVIPENSINIGTTEYIESSYRLDIPHPIATGLMATPGIVTVETWLRSNGTLAVETGKIKVDVIATTVDATDVLLVVNNINLPLVNWTSQPVLDWAVYNKNSLIGTDVRFVITSLDGSSVWIDNTVSGALNNTKYNFAPYLSIELSDVTFDATIKAYINNTLVYSKNVSVDNSNSFAPTANANFIMLPSMRSNADANKRVIINETQVQTEPTQINATWNNVVFEKDGWTLDEDNVKCLKLFAGSSVEIDYSPYTALTSGSGLTMEFDIKTNNISDEETSILEIGHTDELEEFVGLQLCPKAGYMYSTLNKSKYFQDIEWGENERVHIAINIIPGLSVKGGILNLCRMYINGSIRREFAYNPNTASFGLNTDKIKIGGTSADVYVYGIRLYKDRQLSSAQILNDRIASLSNVQEKMQLIQANNIVDGGIISYELAKEKYNTLVWHGNYPDFEHQSTFNGDLDINIINDPSHSGTITNMKVKGQGTSAKTYYKWNGTFSHTSSSVWTDGNGVTKGNYYKLTDNSPKMTKEVGKINYASSPQSHKEGACEAFNALHMAVCGPTGIQRTIQARNIAAGRPENEELPRVAIEEKPFLFFVQTENDTVPVFYCLMTWGSPKGDAATFGYEDDEDSPLNDYLMIEGSDHSPILTLNQAPWFDDEVTYNEEEEYYMYNGEGSWDYDLGNQTSLHKFRDAFNFVYKYSTRIKMWNGNVLNLKNSQGSNPDAPNYADRTYQYIIINSSVTAENYTVHRYNFPTGEWVNAGVTKTNGIYNEYNVDTDLNLGLAGRTIAPGEALSIILAARISAFRSGISQYINVNDTLFLMQFLKFIAASDNRAKNTYPYYDPVDNIIRHAQDDLDTIGPFNNQGQKQKFYWVEEHDIDGRSGFSNAFWAGGTNVLYNTFEDAYREELETIMRSILTAMINDAGSPLAFFEKYMFSIQRYIPAVAYNETARLLYEEAIFASQKGTDTDPLTQSLGSQLECEYEWFKNRIIYIASYCSYYQATGSSIVFRQETSSQYNEIPAMKLYLFRRNGTTVTGPDGYDRRSNSSIYSQRTDKGVTRQFTVTSTDTVQTTTELAEYLSDIGDLSGASVAGTVDFSAGKRLTKLKLGNNTTPLFQPSVISGLPINIQELDIRNISALTSIPSLEDMSKLKKLLAAGTNLTGVILPQTNNLTQLTLPETLTSLTLRNQASLFDANFEYTPTYLKSLTIGNVGIDMQTFILDWLEILKTKTLDDTYTLIVDGIRWLNVAATDLVDLMIIPNIILKGSITLDANSITVEQLAVVNAKLGTLIETGDLVLNYTNILSLNLSKSTIVGDDETSFSTFSISSLDETKQLTLQISTDGETWNVLDETHPAEYVQASNIHDESGSVGKTIKGTLIAPIEVENNIQYRLRATDGTKYSTVSFLNVSKKNRFTGVELSGTKYLTETQHEYTFNATLTPAIASEVPTYNWSIRSVGDMDRYEVENTVGYSRVIRRSDSAIMIELIKVNANSVHVSTGTELMSAKNNNTSFTIACNVLGTYGSEVEATYDVIAHAQFTPKAVQSYDPTEENYNPALIIYLKNNESTTGVTLHEQTFQDGSRGFYMTQEEAATVTNLGPINGLTQVQDVNGYVVESWDGGVNTQAYYTFEDFDQYKYFTRITNCPSINNCTRLHYLSIHAQCTGGMGEGAFPSSLIRLKFMEGFVNGANGVCKNIGHQVDLYLPTTFKPTGWRNNPLFMCKAKKVYYAGTLNEWLSFYNQNPDNGYFEFYAGKYGYDLYCDNELVTTVDASQIPNGRNPLHRCKSLTTISGTITSLPSIAFIACSNLENITISNSITALSWCCFYGCAKLNFTEIPSHITSIAENAFSYSGASFSEIPDSVTSFGQQDNMPNITAISYPNTMSAPGGFTNCANLRSVYFRKNEEDADYYITTLPSFSGCINLSKVGYGEKFYNSSLILPDSITDVNNLLYIRYNTFIMNGATYIQNTSNIFKQKTTSMLYLKKVSTFNHLGYFSNFTYMYFKNINNITISDNGGSAARYNTIMINNLTPPIVNIVFNQIYKILIPKNSKNTYKEVTNWLNNISKLVEYDYTNDPANIVDAVQESNIITTCISLANCAISINNGTATITCTDSTFTSAMPIKLHYRINGGAWSSPVNSGATFAVSANDVIEVYATHSLRAPSNMLKATWDGTNITYDYTNIYIDPDNVDSNGNLIS